MDIGLLGAFSQRVFGLISNQVLIAIPLFIMMGALLEKSRVAEDLLDMMGRAFGQLRGGLGVSVVLVGALLAASTGIVGATVVAMGLIALPAMLRANYSPPVACGIVCTAGTLGQIIPPSTLLIILADVMSNAFQQAQYEQGKFIVEALSVGQFFAAAMFPGLLLVLLYLIYILLRGIIRPADLPPADSGSAAPERAGNPGWHRPAGFAHHRRARFHPWRRGDADGSCFRGRCRRAAACWIPGWPQPRSDLGRYCGPARAGSRRRAVPRSGCSVQI